jgi:DNA helicase-2/ATP-dependent DNA helicase PcrA
VPTITDNADARAEAEGVVATVRRLRPVGGRWGDVAVLARTNDQLELISTALTDHAVPFRIRTRATDLRSPEVQRVLDLLVAHDGDLRSLVDELWDELGPDHPGAVALSIAEQLLVDEPHARPSELAGFVRTLRPGDLSGRKDAVELCTFHSAKGLEWPHVLIVGVEAGLVPLRDDDPEERRLLYVGMTRASRSLHLSWARARTVEGRQVARRRSPLLDAVAAISREPEPVDHGDARERLAAIRADTRLVPESADDDVIADLRGWRDRQARAAGVAAAAVASDRLLAELATSRPTDLDELASLTGWGVLRCRRFGPEVLTLVAARAS